MTKKNYLTTSILMCGLFAIIIFLSQPAATLERVIVQGRTVQSVSSAITAVGGVIIRNLPIIEAVTAELTKSQQSRLLASDKVDRILADRQLSISSVTTLNPETHYPTLSGAAEAHNLGFDGSGVTVAVLDSGLWLDGLAPNNAGKVLAMYEVVTSGGISATNNDGGGHGTHISSIVVNDQTANDGSYQGVAPGANLVSVKAFDANGLGSYSDVIAAMDWIVNNQATYNIRVLNLSFSATPQSFYWQDPLNQAVMAAWQAGIVVVTSAGNTGPGAMTIGVPGNIPYVITVGAMTDNFSPTDGTDDALGSFSSTGPTYEGFIKPEIVAPGGHMLGIMHPDATLATAHPQHYSLDKWFEMSGTSQSAAVVSGIVALLLQAEPGLSPDDVKCRLISSADPALDSSGDLAYSVFQQGAGTVNAAAAIASSNSNCANQGMNIADDLNGIAHYGGPVNQDADGNFYIMDCSSGSCSGSLSGDGFIWDTTYAAGSGFIWDGNYVWESGFIWDGVPIEQSGFIWDTSYAVQSGFIWDGADIAGSGFIWDTGFIWDSNLNPTMGLNGWVAPE